MCCIAKRSRSWVHNNDNERHDSLHLAGGSLETVVTTGWVTLDWGCNSRQAVGLTSVPVGGLLLLSTLTTLTKWDTQLLVTIVKSTSRMLIILININFIRSFLIQNNRFLNYILITNRSPFGSTLGFILNLFIYNPAVVSNYYIAYPPTTLNIPSTTRYFLLVRRVWSRGVPPLN